MLFTTLVQSKDMKQASEMAILSAEVPLLNLLHPLCYFEPVRTGEIIQPSSYSCVVRLFRSGLKGPVCRSPTPIGNC